MISMASVSGAFPAAPAETKGAMSPSGRPYIGGQAVLEGVMMRAPRSFAIVVRRRDGALIVRERKMESAPSSMARWPLVRGVASLVESLRLGSEALQFSAEEYERGLDAEEAASKGPSKAAKGKDGTGLSLLQCLALFQMALASGTADPQGATEKKEGPGAPMMLMLVPVLVFFIALPQAAAALFNRVGGWGLEVQSPGFQAMTGLFKLLIVVGYLLLIRRVPDIYRVFQYHGAEHKTIATYEAGEALTTENARRKTTLHPRCGTTFLVMVALVSILVFTLVGGLLPRIATGNVLLDNVLFFFEKLPFLPVMAAITFELQRFFARYCATGPLQFLLWPGFLVQKITTIEPDDAQLEVALGALRATLFREEGTEATVDGDDVTFPDYASLATAAQLRPNGTAP
jgi:uncharacterized protein YqhQ